SLLRLSKTCFIGNMLKIALGPVGSHVQQFTTRMTEALDLLNDTNMTPNFMRIIFSKKIRIYKMALFNLPHSSLYYTLTCVWFYPMGQAHASVVHNISLHILSPSLNFIHFFLTSHFLLFLEGAYIKVSSNTKKPGMPPLNWHAKKH
ncbi:hypothetical protein ACJX0J_005533, partial [Zea mays]